MTTGPFAHLHCHSHYSLLDGAAPIDKLIARTKDHGMNALALTDHGNLHGALEFYRKAKEAGINPILGYEAYIAPGHRTHSGRGMGKESSYHLTLLAKDRIGFQNLVRLASLAFLEGFYRKPRIDKECLTEYSQGLICLSGCVSGELSNSLLRHGTGDFALEEPLEIARWFHALFENRYFIEIQNNGSELQRAALEGSLEVSRRLGIPTVATSDAHYVDPEDSEMQDILLCINTGRFRSDPNRLRMDTKQYYLRSPSEMYEVFRDHPSAVARSQEIADSVEIDLELGRRHFPTYRLPAGETPEGTLRALCEAGLQERYAHSPDMCHERQLAPAVRERLDRELDVIGQLGFSNYFLIVWDFVRKARELDIPATARGSGVGALVSYALYLSHVCPIKFDLLFERFLDPSRKEAPDIDIDFCKDRRGEIIRYVKEKYGEANVAQIGTFGTLAAKAAIRDVARALGMPLARVNQIVQLVPDQLKVTLDQALEQSSELRQHYEQDPEVRQLLDLARNIEGLAKNVGTHAAAVVIADRPLTEYVPLGRVTGKSDIITQWSMNDVEAAGLLKMDFLGLRNLTVLAKAVERIRESTGATIDPYQLPLDDKPTFELLARGETKGIFQLESGGIRDLLQRMKPDCFGDIIATNALYRPGPLEGGMVDDYVAVKNGRKAPRYLHPVLEEVLSETHGVMVYQEQVMRILNRLGDIELANAYACIKAISKKKASTINAFHDQFLAGAMARGLAKKQSQELWELIQKFAGYGFNKSHSTAYALIAYMTAYLKAHYPVEFMAALLSGDIDARNFKRKDSLVEHLEDCQRMGVKVHPPDVNDSHVDFRVVQGEIRFALSAIKGCGVEAMQAIVAARDKGGPFRNLFDFSERVDASKCNRATLETLIKAGAFDSLGARRAQCMAVLDRALQSGAAAANDRRIGQRSLFDELPTDDRPEAIPFPDIPEWDRPQCLSLEKEVLGYYLSCHPLAEYQELIARYCPGTISDLQSLKDRSEVSLCGLISSIKISHVKKARTSGEPTRFANFDLEDTQGAVRCILWPNEFERFGPLIQPDAIRVVRGVVDRRGGSDEVNLIIRDVMPLESLEGQCTQSVRIRFDEARNPADQLKLLCEIARRHPGTCELQLELQLRDGQRVSLRSNSLRVDGGAEFKRQVTELLEPGCLELGFRPLTHSGPAPKTRHGWQSPGSSAGRV